MRKDGTGCMRFGVHAEDEHGVKGLVDALHGLIGFP
jgi:hypothetical protein